MKFFFSIVFGCVFFNLVAQSPIIPAPVVYKAGNGTLFIGNSLTINPINLPEEVKTFLKKELTLYFQVNSVFSPTSNTLVRFKKIANTPPDFYSITVNEDILIQYSSNQSCFYAANSLVQLLQGEPDNYFISKCFVQDYPKFQWRGLHLDVARHFFTVEEVKRFIDWMALYKFNTFHWHLTDDQGWRIEIKKYPKLTEVGAWRDSTVNGHYTDEPRSYSVKKYGGFYTQEEIKEVVQYASEKFITIVPEIEMPGHSRAALAAYPHLSCTGKQLEVPGLWGVFEDVFCAKEESLDFLKDVLSEVIELFPSTYIHIGGDEVPKTRWNECPKCQKIVRENGLKDGHELQAFFIQKMDEFLNAKGKKLIGWDEILEGGLSPNAAVMSWRGMEGGVQAAKQQHMVVMSPGSHCYFDHYQSDYPNEPLAIGGFTPIEKVYEFQPIPAELSAQEGFYILGGQANLWTEYIPNMAKLEYMTYPRALALSQVLWTETKPSFADFKFSLENYHFDFLERHNIHFSKAMHAPKMHLERSLDGLQIRFSADKNQFPVQLKTTSRIGDSVEDTSRIYKENDKVEIARTVGQELVAHTLELKGNMTDATTAFRIMAHPALGIPVELITKPAPQYAANGGLTLVDGVFGSKPWRGNEWLGFDEPTIELQADLSRTVKVDRVVLNFLNDPASWIHLPNSVEVWVSRNKKRWKKMAELQQSKSSKENGVKLPTAFYTSNKGKGRYIKLIIHAKSEIPAAMPGEGNKPWTFLDELVLFYRK